MYSVEWIRDCVKETVAPSRLLPCLSLRINWAEGWVVENYLNMDFRQREVSKRIEEFKRVSKQVEGEEEPSWVVPNKRRRI